MDSIICKKTFDLGKIDFFGTGRRINAVTVNIELRKCGGEPTFKVVNGTRIYTGKTTPEYTELSICGNVWNLRRTDIVCGGQCLDEIAKRISPTGSKMTVGQLCRWLKLYRLWKNYHLNGMHAGTPAQEAAIEEWKAEGNRYDYKEACWMLKERGLYRLRWNGKTVGQIGTGRRKNKYTYGHSWLIYDLPESVVEDIKAMCA